MLLSTPLCSTPLLLSLLLLLHSALLNLWEQTSFSAVVFKSQKRHLLSRLHSDLSTFFVPDIYSESQQSHHCEFLVFWQKLEKKQKMGSGCKSHFL